MRETRSVAPLRRLRRRALDRFLSPRNGLRPARLALALVLVASIFPGPGCGRGGRAAAAPPAGGVSTPESPPEAGAAAWAGPGTAVQRSARAGPPIIGVKVYEASAPFDGLFRAWRELGVNALFLSEALLLNPDFRARAKADGLTLFLIYPIFQGPEVIKEHPAMAAVTAAGVPARDEWVEFVCPARGPEMDGHGGLVSLDDHVELRIRRLRSLVAEGDPDFVSLDFIRFFVFWEKVAPDRAPESLPQTCFCPLCLLLFQNEFGVKVPADLAGTARKAKWILENHADEWTEWKCGRIAKAVSRLAAAAREVKPSVKFNLHAVPWRRNDFAGAIRSVAGQDFARLAPLVDLVSPMTYHHMARRTPSWVHDVVADLAAQTKGAPILPSIQVSNAYVENELPPEEFRAALEQALRPPSMGVVLWSWEALSKSPEKMEVLKSLAGLKK